MLVDPAEKHSDGARATPLLPQIVGFDEMFVTHQPDDDGTEKKLQPGVGLPFSSTLLLSRPPGAGKTTFALSMVYALIVQAEQGNSDKPSPLKLPIVYFISLEINMGQCGRCFIHSADLPLKRIVEKAQHHRHHRIANSFGLRKTGPIGTISM